MRTMRASARNVVRTLTQPTAAAATIPTSAAPPGPGRRRNSSPIVLAVLVLLLFAIGVRAAFQLIANSGGTRPAGGGQSAGRSADSSATTDAPAQRAPTVGKPTGGALGAGGKAESDIDKPAENATQPGQPIEQREKATANTGAPAAAENPQAATAVAGFLGALSSAVGGAHRHDPVDFHTLEALLPSSLPDMQPATPDGSADETMNIKTTVGHVSFS